jgi:glycosyltransferase involved in cell wall biosynthesis
LRYDFHTAIAARRTGTAHWVSRAVALADDSYAFPARSLYWLVDAWTLRACDGIVAVSQASMRRMMQTQRLPASRFTVIPNGVRVREPAAEPRAAARAEMGAAPGDFVIGGVGQLIPRKAFEVLVAAVAQLPAPRPRLVLLGDGPERPRLAAQAQALGVALQLAGFRPDPAAWMANFSVLVLPSRAEGMPLVVLEAMALGVPCIATPVAGTAEVIEDGVSGILTPVGDAAALAAALQRLRTDLPRRDALAAAGRERVAREFSQAAMLQRFRDLLLHAAAGRRRR